MAKFRRIAAGSIYFFLGYVLTGSAFAAPAIATVTSAVPFTLDGHAVSSPGVASFPLVAGDTVTSSNGPAVLLFHDGSTVKLGLNSSVKLDAAGANLKVVLLAGDLDYKLVAGSHISLANLNTVRSQTAGDPNPASNVAPRRLASVLGSPGFIISAGGSTVGLATALLNPFSSQVNATTSAATSGTLAAHLPPVSRHL